MNDAENFCSPCGLCCDGTLIGFVQLDRVEVPRLREVMDIEEVNGNGVFLHPCKKYCGGCTIYSERPKQCGLFKCGLLKSLEQKKMDLDSAIEIINEVRQKKAAIEKKVAKLQFELKSQSFNFKMIELKTLLQKKKPESSLTQAHLELMSDINQLDNLLLKKFDVSFY